MLPKQTIRETVDPMNPYAPVYSGAFHGQVTIGDDTRAYIAYIPEGTRASTAGVMVLPDDHCSAADMLEKSTWRQIADAEPCKEKLIVIFLEPKNGMWNTNEPYGDAGGDVAYVDAVFNDIMRRNKFCIHESKCYIAGYGAGADTAQKAIMWNPAVYAGLVCVGGNGVDTRYFEAAGDAACVNLHGFEDPDHKRGYLKKDIPVPVWLIDTGQGGSEAFQTAAAYWKKACRADAFPKQIDPETFCFLPSDEPEFPVNKDKNAHRVWESRIANAGEDFGRLINQRIWKDFLYGVRRWMADPGGDLRLTADPVRDLDMDYHYEPVGGWMREWYVYVPDSVKRCSDQSVPLVFAMHGYTCSGEIYIGNTEWHKVARDNGFIVVFPSAVPDTLRTSKESRAFKEENMFLPAWNLFSRPDRPDELAFFQYMLESVSKNYCIDLSRVFATGHSWGSMMAHYLGMALPGVFTAIAPCSGVLFEEFGDMMLQNPHIIKTPETQMPVWMFAGEEEPWLMPAVPEKDNLSGKTIRLWWERNRMDGQKPEKFDEGWTISNGRWNDLEYKKDNLPMIRYTWVKGMPHATMTEMSYRIWDAFFSRLRRHADGHITYSG